MTTPKDSDLARGWLFAERLIEEEADRICELSDEEAEKALDELPELSHMPTADELLAKAKARAKRREEATAAGEEAKSELTRLDLLDALEDSAAKDDETQATRERTAPTSKKASNAEEAGDATAATSSNKGRGPR